MRNCYLTGKELKTRGESSSLEEVESLEHIIPNALGGKLRSKNILSHDSNQYLNELIDVKFVKIFEGFCLRLDLEKDRQKTPSMRGFHEGYKIDVVFKHDRFYPLKPFFDKEKKTIYADSIKTGEYFKVHLKKKGVISELDEISILDDMGGGIDIEFKMDNKIFKQGLAKIAAGFSAFNNIPRKNLRDVVDLEGNTFREKIFISPSIPAGGLEYEFEIGAINSPHYPIHGLVLVGSKKERLLYCHVELFSAFQWYVVLDDDYDGEDVYYTYAHQLIGDTEISIKGYIESVLGKEKADALASEYKKISKDQIYLYNQSHRFGNENLKKYTYMKFNLLSRFTNVNFLRRKIKYYKLDFEI